MSLCLGLFLAAGLLTQQAVALSDPQEIVRSFYGTLLATMQQSRVLGESGRYARLAPVVDRTFDLPFMTRLAIGPGWDNLPAPQQRQLFAAFAHYVGATYADRFDTNSGEQLQVTGERSHGSDVMVQTKIVKPDGETTRLDYLMRQDTRSLMPSGKEQRSKTAT